MFERHPILEEIRRRRWPHLTNGMTGLSGMSGMVGTLVNYITDLFAGANGTNIQSHTPDLGGTWVQSADGNLYQLNAANKVTFTDATGTHNEKPCVIDASVSDFKVECDLTSFFTGTGGNRFWSCLVFRYSDDNNFWLVYPNTTVLPPQITLADKQAGVLTDRGAAAASGIVSGSPNTVRVQAAGNNINVYVDGVLLVSYSSSFNASATKVGLNAHVSGTQTAPTWDNLRVTNP